MSTQIKKRFTFDRRKLTIDPVPTIYYYKNINDATVKLNFYSNKNVVNLIPLSVCDWIWNGCNFEINLTKWLLRTKKMNKYKVTFPHYKRFPNCPVRWTIQPHMHNFLWMSTHARDL